MKSNITSNYFRSFSFCTKQKHLYTFFENRITRLILVKKIYFIPSAHVCLFPPDFRNIQNFAHNYYFFFTAPYRFKLSTKTTVLIKQEKMVISITNI